MNIIKLRTWAGRSQFRYQGSVKDGTDIYYGKRFKYRVTITPETYVSILGEFKKSIIPCGTIREIEKRPRNSLGYWLGQNITKTAIASYVAPILIYEGYATKKGGLISFN